MHWGKIKLEWSEYFKMVPSTLDPYPGFSKKQLIHMITDSPGKILALQCPVTAATSWWFVAAWQWRQPNRTSTSLLPIWSLVWTCPNAMTGRWADCETPLLMFFTVKQSTDHGSPLFVVGNHCYFLMITGPWLNQWNSVEVQRESLAQWWNRRRSI